MIDKKERLKLCKICTQRKFDSQMGIICALTMDNPSFSDFCADFKQEKNSVEITEQKSYNLTGVIASSEKRFANHLLDTIFYLIFSFFFGIIIAIFGFADILTEINDYVIGFFIASMYYIFFEAVFKQTPGKMITKTRVVTDSGKMPSFENIIGRTLCRFIPFDAFSYLGSDAIGWHDSISKTRVIDIIKFEKDESTWY